MDRIARFEEAQGSVYGPFAPDEERAKTWTPPERSGGHRGRYLWTDAFGVVNFITLSIEKQDPRYLIHACRLTKAVHETLGWTRDRSCRLPGASDENPVGGGLRIGKIDEAGSDGDGQYHHYLTIWMFALNRLSMATMDDTYNHQAIALARAIHPRFFIDRKTSRLRMVWKITVDMLRPLAWSQGNLDPLDGYVVFRMLQAASGDASVLDEEIEDYRRLMHRKGKHSVSTDPLDLGMTLWTSHWLSGEDEYFTDLMRQAIQQAHKLFDAGYLDIPRMHRLAFREYGTCLGIGCLDVRDSKLESFRNGLIETWERDRSSNTIDLRAISEVMRAAALIPGAFQAGYLRAEPELES